MILFFGLVIYMMFHLGHMVSQSDLQREIMPDTPEYLSWRSTRDENFDRMLREISDGGVPVGRWDKSFESKWLPYFVKQVRDMKSEEVSQCVDARIGTEDLLLHPSHYRGRFVRIRGFLWYGPEPRSFLEVKNPEGITGVVQWIIEDTLISRKIFLYSSDKGSKPLTAMQDNVEIEGMFMRIHPYEAADGEIQQPLLILVKNIRRVELVSGKGAVTLLVLIGAGVVVAAFLVIGYMQRRSRKEAPLQKILQDARAKRRSAERKSSTSASDETPPPDPPIAPSSE